MSKTKRFLDVIKSLPANSGLDADLLDGRHGSWYPQNVTNFKKIKSASSSNPIDLNNDLLGGGIGYNYRTRTAWSNNPADGYGCCLELSPNTDTHGLAGQLFWTIVHDSKTPTDGLWWRAASSSHGFQDDWHKIAFVDGNVASADKLTSKQLTNEDLDTLKDSGFSTYFGNSANTCMNKPDGVAAFNLQVLKTDDTTYVQILTTHNGDTYKRRFYVSWSAWKKMLTEDDIAPLIARIDALEKK